MCNYFLRRKLEISPKKRIDDDNNCYDNCSITQNNKLEYKGKCFTDCPENTTLYNNRCYSKDEPCDINCKTCLFNSDSTISSNCTSCFGSQILYEGKCFDECEMDKCKICSDESKENNLCLICNEEKNYFSKSTDKGKYIDCYKGNISGYYLDTNNKYYMPCYPSCETCNFYGNETNHNCLSCSNNYSYE